jgi:guanylate kinase
MEPDHRARRGIIFILSAPSGAGKTTISRRAMDKIDGLELSVSFTTRAPRPGERPGQDYYFVTEEEFQRRADAGEFAEFARVFESRYGTLRAPVEHAIFAGRDLLLDIDVRGAEQIRARYSHDAVTIFVMPPSFAELEDRLRRRGTETPDAIERRLKHAHAEAAECLSYDYLIVNANVDESLERLAAIVNAERLKMSRLAEGFLPWKS